MKKGIVIAIVLSLCVLSNAYAANTPGKKFVRGVVNVVSAPLEIPKQARAYWIEGAKKTPHIIAWIFCGAVWGVVQTVKRAGSGAWDIVSFLVDKPEQYEPVFKPDYVVQEWPKNPVSGR